MRRIVPLFISCILFACGACQANSKITIYRDNFGTPAIVAGSLEDSIFGLGYSCALDNAERMALNYKQARGRMAEVEGKGQLLTDGFVRSLGIEAAAESKAKSLDGEVGKLVRAYVAGANRGLAEQKGKLPGWISPFTDVDVLSLAQLLNAAFPLQGLSSKLMPSSGSNQFAVGSKRSANHHAILSTDPHLEWDGVLAWYEFGIHSPQLNFHGITLPGLPFGTIGHNDRVAWSNTNNDPSLYTIYTVKLNPNNSQQYRYHGEWRDLETYTYELKYLENGENKTRKQNTRMTAWGPMLPLQSRAVQFSMIGNWDLLGEILAMMRSKDVAEFREALRPCGVSMWNLVAADTRGNIAYQYNARVPRRDESVDWNKTVDGSDPKTKWGALWTIDELPHAVNPKSNLLCNCNSAPWLTPMGNEINSTGWPSYITTYGHTTRVDNLQNLLRQDNHISVEAAKRYATDTHVPYAGAAIRILTTFAKSTGSSDPEFMTALAVLNKWNVKADVDSRGCGLYLYWYRGNSIVRTFAERAQTGKRITREEFELVAQELAKAAVALKLKFGRLDVTWGEIQQSHRGTKVSPVAGFGYVQDDRGRSDRVAAVMPTFGSFRDGKIAARGGSSFRMVVDMDPGGVKSWSILPYGDSNLPTSPHFGDQMEMYGRGQYKSVLFQRKDILKLSTSRVVIER